MTKAEQRKHMLQLLKRMTKPQYDERCAQIVARLLDESTIQQAQTIALTLSNFPEVETRGLIEALWQKNKRVVVPKSNAKTREMIFYHISSFEQLEQGYAAIEEPIVAQCEAVAKEQIDVIIVPGVLFDRKGYRIGFGGGFYDRYLHQFVGKKIALAFQEQVVESVPAEQHDIPVEIIVTDRETIEVGEEAT